MAIESADYPPDAVRPARQPPAVSIRTVAERAGVSIATVSNVINKRTNVGDVLARRVREAVEELGYVVDGAASRLRSRRQALAGVIVPDLKTPMFGSFVSTLEARARRDGFDLIVASCRDDAGQEAERLNAIRAWRPAGCIVIPVDGALAQRRPKGHDMPIVAVDRIPDAAEFDLIAIDNTAAADTMMRHLRDQGHRRCLVAAYDMAVTNLQERWRGAVQGAGDAIALELLEVGSDPLMRKEGLQRRLARGSWPDVVFCLDHVTTLAAFQVMTALAIRIPAQMALASFDDSEWMSLVTPAVTAIGQPVEAMADAAWTHLLRRVGGDRSAPRTVRLPCEFVLRGSTARRMTPP